MLGLGQRSGLFSTVGLMAMGFSQEASASSVGTPFGTADSSCVHEVPMGAGIDIQTGDVRLNGKIITPVLDFNLGSQPVVPGHFPDAPLLHDEGFLRNVIDRSEKTLKGAPDWLQKRYGWISSEEARAKKGYVLCSLVTGIDGAEDGQSFGNVLVVPGFGNIFFGELIVAQNSYRLTMVRVEMGCVAEGNLSVGSSFSNGRPIP